MHREEEESVEGDKDEDMKIPMYRGVADKNGDCGPRGKSSFLEALLLLGCYQLLPMKERTVGSEQVTSKDGLPFFSQ